VPYFLSDSIRFHYDERGDGLPFIFQHGLGSEVSQPFGILTPPSGCRLLAFDFRAHGLTEPIGSHDQIGIRSFARDLAAFLDHLNIERAVVGGISLGAAVALNFAIGNGSRVIGLIVSRPAWFVGPNFANAPLFLMIATLLKCLGPVQGKEFFRQTALYENVESVSCDAAKSLLSQFDSAQCVQRAVRLDRIGIDAAVDSAEEFRKVNVPTLVLANRQDPIHDYEFGLHTAQKIENSEFQEITPKSNSVERHVDDVNRHICGFLCRHFL
jgi:pimeloyl-ACP methyl ester carboxylesterase